MLAETLFPGPVPKFHFIDFRWALQQEFFEEVFCICHALMCTSARLHIIVTSKHERWSSQRERDKSPALYLSRHIYVLSCLVSAVLLLRRGWQRSSANQVLPVCSPKPVTWGFALLHEVFGCLLVSFTSCKVGRTTPWWCCKYPSQDQRSGMHTETLVCGAY